MGIQIIASQSYVFSGTVIVCAQQPTSSTEVFACLNMPVLIGSFCSGGRPLNGNPGDTVERGLHLLRWPAFPVRGSLVSVGLNYDFMYVLSGQPTVCKLIWNPNNAYLVAN